MPPKTLVGNMIPKKILQSHSAIKELTKACVESAKMQHETQIKILVSRRKIIGSILSELDKAIREIRNSNNSNSKEVFLKILRSIMTLLVKEESELHFVNIQKLSENSERLQIAEALFQTNEENGDNTGNAASPNQSAVGSNTSMGGGKKKVSSKKKIASKKKVRKIHKGPRGGKYYISKGQKVYL